VGIASAPAVARVGTSGRAACQAPRARGVPLEQEAEIRALAGIRTLRSLAAEFGVSHETVRRAVKGP
jgi:hypothetical protein